ncbi:hypothetical protein ACHAXA_010802 [Cyclostephanos tholiformis]|uniref:Uncharacterized protein n=1 Tax=Cyclostephanos tholiformis TaxID=382380 RepID=A0ABD3R591_9STRA
MRSFFGIKKDAGLQPSTSSVHRGNNNSRTETANSILKLREGIATQEKRAMEAGKNAMAAIRKETDIERVDELIDDVKEEMEAASEISNALTQPIDPFVTDEDDLLAELEEMIADDALGAPVVKAHRGGSIPNCAD